MEILSVPQQALSVGGELAPAGQTLSAAGVLDWWRVSSADVRRALAQRGVLVAALCGALCDQSGWHDAKEVRLLPSESEADTVPVYRVVRPEGRMRFTLASVMACTVEMRKDDADPWVSLRAEGDVAWKGGRAAQLRPFEPNHASPLVQNPSRPRTLRARAGALRSAV